MKRTGIYVCYFIKSNTEKEFSSLKEAQEAAENYCGNNKYSKPFPNEPTYMYGPGDGTTSVMIRELIDFNA